MTDQELMDNSELYALGLLDGDTRKTFEDHLKRNPHLAAGVAAAFRTVALLGASAPEADPPPGLRARLLARVAQLADSPSAPVQRDTPSRFAWWQWIPALAAVAMVVLLIRGNLQQDALRTELATARAQLLERESALGMSQRELTQLRRAVTLLGAPGTRLARFGQGPAGTAFVNPQSGVVLLASNLPRLEAGRIFQMWLIPKTRGGAPAPAGLFTADATGRAIHLLEGAVDLATLAAVAVSVEPAGGSAAPTTTPIVVAPVAD